MPDDATLSIFVKLRDLATRQFKTVTGRMERNLKGVQAQAAATTASLGAMSAASATAASASRWGPLMGALSKYKYLIGGAGAALALNFGRRQAVELAKIAAESQDISRGFETLQASIGAFSGRTLVELRRGIKDTVDDTNLMRLANEAVLMGAARTSEEFGLLAEAGRRLGQAIGKDTLTGYSLLVQGIGRGTQRMLQQLGIMVDVKAAQEEYAQSINKTVGDLTELERKEAFRLRAYDEIRRKLKILGTDTDTLSNKISRFSAAWENLKDTISQIVGPAVANFLDKMAVGLKNVQNLLVGIQQLSERTKGPAVPSTRIVSEEAEKFGREYQWKTPLGKLVKRIRSEFIEALAPKFFESAIKTTFDAVEKQLEVEKKRRTETPVEGKPFGLPEDFVSATPYVELTQTELPPAMQEVDRLNNTWDAIISGMRQYTAEVGNVFEILSNSITDTFVTIEQNLGTFFFDAMMGRLKTFKDYMRSFLTDMARMISQYLAKLAVSQMVTGAIGGLFGLFGGPGVINFGLANAGGGIIPSPAQMGIRPMQEGGIVNRPTLALLGERGPEAVVPLNRGNQNAAVNISFAIQAWDGASVRRTLKEEQPFIESMIQGAVRGDPHMRSTIRSA